MAKLYNQFINSLWIMYNMNFISDNEWNGMEWNGIEYFKQQIHDNK